MKFTKFLQFIFAPFLALMTFVTMSGVAMAANQDPSMVILSADTSVEGEELTIRTYATVDGIPQRVDLPADWNLMVWNTTTLEFEGSFSNGKVDHAVDVPDGLDSTTGIYVFTTPDYGDDNDYEVELRDERGIVVDVQNFTVIKDLGFHVDSVSMESDIVSLGEKTKVTVSGKSEVPGAFGFSLRLPSDLPAGWYMEIWHSGLAAVTLTGSTKDGYIERDEFGSKGVYSFDGPNALGDYTLILKDENGVKVDSQEFTVVQSVVFQLNPSVIDVESAKVLAGSTVTLKTFIPLEDAEDMFLSVDEDWDIQLWRAAGIAGDEEKVASLKEGEISKSGAGAGEYTFTAPALDVGYELRLVNSLGGTVAIDHFTVVKVGIKIPDLTVNFPEIVFHIPDEILPEPSEDQSASEICMDVESDFWANDIMTTLLGDNNYPVVVEGDAVHCRPLKPVLRKEFTMWLLDAYHSAEVADIAEFHQDYNYDESPFSDVDGSDPYDPYIVLAAQLGIINGHPDGTFKPNDVINRAEVLKILLRSSGLYMDTAFEREHLLSVGTPDWKFEDVSDESVWFYWYLFYATQPEVHIIEGRQYPLGNGGVFRKADMGEPVLFSEAAKILFLAQKFEAEADAQ